MKNIVYSHGFGVDKTDRGLFSDIANSLPDYEHHMFDYNTIDDSSGHMIASPLTIQTEKLRRKIDEFKPNVIIAHSQGCVITSIVAPASVEQIIFVAPPYRFANNKTDKMLQKEGVTEDSSGNILLPRSDGSTTVVPQAYFDSRKDIDPISLFNNLSTKTNLVIIRAVNDEVLESVDTSGLSSLIEIIDMPTGHNFEGNSRSDLLELVDKILG